MPPVAKIVTAILLGCTILVLIATAVWMTYKNLDFEEKWQLYREQRAKAARKSRDDAAP